MRGRRRDGAKVLESISWRKLIFSNMIFFFNDKHTASEERFGSPLRRKYNISIMIPVKVNPCVQICRYFIAEICRLSVILIEIFYLRKCCVNNFPKSFKSLMKFYTRGKKKCKIYHRDLIVRRLIVQKTRGTKQFLNITAYKIIPVDCFSDSLQPAWYFKYIEI